MNTRMKILSGTAIAAFAFLVYAETQTETTIVEDFQNAFFSGSSVENVDYVAMEDGTAFEPITDMIPPQIEPAAGGDEMSIDAEIENWANVPTPEVQTNVEGEVNQARSGFEDPTTTEEMGSDLTDIMPASGDTIVEETTEMMNEAGETVNDTVDTMMNSIDETVDDMMGTEDTTTPVAE